MCSKQTFRGFVNMCCKKYQRYKSSNPPFMDLNTFISWFFAWASRMRIDFRMPCEGCNGPPKVLACDGTKIGIGFRNTFVTPIETPTKPAPASSNGRRLDRCFLSCETKDPETKRLYSKARSYLRFVCDCILQRKCELLASEDNVLSLNSLISYLPSESISAFHTMHDRETDFSVRRAYAAVFRLLSYDACLDAVVPLYICNQCLLYIDKIRLGSATKEMTFNMISLLQCFNAELAHLLQATMNDGFTASSPFICLLRYCCNLVNKIHNNDVLPEDSSPIPHTYNPPKFGRAYYFASHGQQVRQIRRFNIDSKSNSGNFDDTPELVCSKAFPQVSKKGTSYLFLWFCPMHGHCYGYHIIPGSEGRKDPAASLYAYSEVPPDVVLYDFACSLSEYVHNRESGFFASTRFYHDIFHGFTHKCTSAFRYDKLNGFGDINSSICEQFNSFLQKIKTSAKLMSQVHFSFFVQFFIHQWNKQKAAAEKSNVRTDIADACRQ